MEYRIKSDSFFIAAVFGVVAWTLSSNIAIGIAVFALLLVLVIVEIYVPYVNNNPEHLWFKRKLYGWGWTPVTWQGWLVTLLYIVLVALCTLTIDEASPTREIFFTFVLPVLLLTISFLRITYKKGETPKWQWGKKEHID